MIRALSKERQPDSISFNRNSLLQTVSSSPDRNGSYSRSHKYRRFKDLQELQKLYSPSVLNGGLYSGLAILEPIRRPIVSEERMFPYEDSMPCETCGAITVEALLSVGGYRHHSLAAATAAARDGCKICGLMMEGFIIEDDTDWVLEPIILRLANSSGTPYCQDEVWATVGDSSRILGLYTDDGKIVYPSFL